MGLRGPAKTPTAVILANGNPGHFTKAELSDEGQPKFAEGEPEMPPMSPAARKIWKQTVAILMTVEGLLSVADGAVLADYCECRARKDAMLKALTKSERRALAEAKKSGTKIDKAEIKQAVWLKYEAAFARLWHRENVLRREIGLSASARSSMRLPGGGNQKQEVDPEDIALLGQGPRLVAV